MISYVLNEHDKIEAKKVSSEKRTEAKERIMSNDQTYKKVRTNKTVQSFVDNRSKVCDPHRYEARTGVDHTDLICGRVPFSAMTKKRGFDKVVLEEIAARNITLTDDEKKNYTKTIKRLKTHEGNNKSFKPVLPFEQFRWYE